jgi:uncharacterized membrane protein
MQLFLIRGLVAVTWAAVFAAVSDSLTTGVTVAAGILVVIYPLIDVAASWIDARSQRGSARRVLLAGVGFVGFGIAYVIASTGADPMLNMLAIYAAGGGIDFLVQAWLLARRRHRLATLPA